MTFPTLKVLHNKSADALKKLMGLSDSLARLNRDRYHAFRDASPEAPVEGIAKQAAFAFDGPAFRGLDAATLDKPAVRLQQEPVKSEEEKLGGFGPSLCSSFFSSMGVLLIVCEGTPLPLY